MNISFEEEYFQKTKEGNHIVFSFNMPNFKEEMVWTPEIKI